MRILQLGKFYPILGGVEKVEWDLMTGLSAQGVDCDMLCAMVEGPSRDIVLNQHARLIGCHALRKVAATMISPAMIFKLRKIRRNYDIIHVHHPDPMACLALFLSGYKGKVILHWHSDIEKQKQLLKLYRPLQDWLIRRADLIVGTTPVYTAESPYLQDVQHKVATLPIGVDPINPDPEAVEKLRSAYPGKKIVFTLGRLVPYKGYKYLIEAARYLPDDYVVLIGGSGPLRDELSEQITLCDVQHKVKLLGRISDADLPAYFGACDLFCLSSIQKTEAFGIVQLEAMSCGKPVVATTIPHSGVAWVNADGESGVNVPPHNAKALAEAITGICGDPDKYAALSAGALARFTSTFTKSAMIARVLTLYRQTLNS